MNQDSFLKKYNISKENFKNTELDWNVLKEIFIDFNQNKHIYEPAAKDIVERLITLKTVHSVKYRIKDAEHLIEKIIRKKLEDPERDYTPDNYSEKIDDIIGVRALHLYKSGWEEIGDFISETWSLKGNPTANIRKGDSDEIQDIFSAKGYDIKEHKFGYRSIHYIIETSPTKNKFTSELQVRTIFEEAWSEIDHDIRYPYEIDNPILNGYLNMFNRLAGNADEMGTFIQVLQKHLLEINDRHNITIKERDKVIKDLKTKITKLDGDRSLKREINVEIDKLINSTKSISKDYFSSSKDIYFDPMSNVNSNKWNEISNFSRKCKKCNTLEFDHLNPTKPKTLTYLTLGNQFRTCPSCNQFLCGECWPRFNPFVLRPTLTTNSSLGNHILNEPEKVCPKCAAK